jgi:uncharacterized protein (DUF1697 family)
VKTWIALFRGINMIGRHLLPMKELVVLPEGVSEPELCVTFLGAVPGHPDLNALEAVWKDSERFELRGKAFYMHAPEGMYRSKLAGRIERSLGVPVTSRTWSTIEKVMAMLKEMG